MAVILRINLRRKDAASNTEGFTQSSVNYLRYLMNGSRI